MKTVILVVTWMMSSGDVEQHKFLNQTFHSQQECAFHALHVVPKMKSPPEYVMPLAWQCLEVVPEENA